MSQSISKGGFIDRHPILVPATLFSLCWVPYIVIFFRSSIAFGDVGGPVPFGDPLYWLLFALQLLVCVISHSLTLRTIIRMYAPRWLIFGSIAFFCLSPAWGLLTAADIRHPMFAAVFCVFVSSLVFVLYSRKRSSWLWIQLGAGALCVCLLRSEGAWSVFPTLAAMVAFLVWEKRHGDIRYLEASPSKKRESKWSDVFAAFLTVTAVALLFAFSIGTGQSVPLGQPDFGATESPVDPPWGANLTGTDDVAGILPFQVIETDSMFPSVAVNVADFIWIQQCIPIIDLTFSWAAYIVLFVAFSALALRLWIGRPREARPIVLALPMVVVIVFMLICSSDATLRYIMPVLAAQPMFFASVLKVSRG